MKKELIENKIKQVDEKLDILRESWMDARPKKKGHWMARIDEVLDDRLVLMEQRDAV